MIRIKEIGSRLWRIWFVCHGNLLEFHFFFPFIGEILGNNGTSPPHYENINDSYNELHNHSNPSMVIFIFFLLTTFFFVGFVLIYFHCYMKEDEIIETSQWGVHGYNAHSCSLEEGTHGIDKSITESFLMFGYYLRRASRNKWKKCLSVQSISTNSSTIYISTCCHKCNHAFYLEFFELTS